MVIGAFLKPFYFGVGTSTISEISSQEPVPDPAPSLTQAPRTIGASGGLLSFNFDDGFLSNYERAIPILDKVGIKTTQYIISGALEMDGYVTKEQILDMEKRGHEIGAHTRTHPRLTELTESQQRYEVIGSMRDLSEIGVKSVKTFAYPYGAVDGGVEKIVKESGFAGARFTQPGLNDKNTNRFRLKRLEVDAGVEFPDVQRAIDDAITKKKWLILLFHRIDEDGYQESARHEMLQKIVDYIQSRNIAVVTNAEGLKLIGNIK